MLPPRALINSIIATMTIFQLTYQESAMMIQLSWIIHSYFMENPKQKIETILLQNGLFIFGCFIGTSIAVQLQNRSNKFIFLLSELINFFSLYNYLLLNFHQDDFQKPHKLNTRGLMKVNFYIGSQLLIAISLGINYTQACIYVKEISRKTKKGYLFFLIPFQLQGGLALGCLTGNEFPIRMFCHITTIVRMILLIIVDIETPNYYFFVKKNIKATKKVLSKIHGDKEIQQSIIIQFQGQQSIDSETSQTKLYFKKLLLCINLVVISQLSGFQIFNMYYFNYIQLWYFPSNFGIGNYFSGLLIILLLMLFVRKRRRSSQILIGQFIVCLALAIFSFTYSKHLQGLAVYFLTLGYYIGLGSLIFQIIPIILPKIGLINCIKAQWIFDLVQICLLGIFYKKSKNQQEYLLKFIDMSKICFYLSCFATLFLYFILRVYIKYYQNRKNIEVKQEKNEDDNQQIELGQNQY